MKSNKDPFPRHAAFVLILLFALAMSVAAQTNSWRENWESPTVQDDWYADNGVWEIGPPSYGPPTNSFGFLTHEGLNCAATILNGDYPDNRESRLRSQPVRVPAASENPRLRFWHWWSFSCDDYGQVQVSTDGGNTWEAASGAYSADSYDRWSRAWVDLTPWAGRTVTIALFFHSQNNGSSVCGYGSPDVSSGWYVDDMVLEAGEIPVPEAFGTFEAGWAGWRADYIGGQATDFAIWEIGSPTSGPGLPHSGTNCAATILGGNYQDNRTSRLVGPPIKVPAAAESPRLRFWHWWSFSCDDYGAVQISTNNGASWEDLSGSYYADSSGSWSRAQLNLSAYGGLTVRLGFYFYSNNNGSSTCGYGAVDVSDGWYIDELAIETGNPPPSPIYGTFEDGWKDWTADYFGGQATGFAIWEIGAPTSGPGAAHSGVNCAATVLGGDYFDNRTSRLVGPPIQIPAAAENPRLRFWHWWSFSCDDYGVVQVSTNNGASWDNLSGSYYADSSGRWSRAWLDLSAYAGLSVRLGFYFYSSNNGSSTCGYGAYDVSDGWYVDDVLVETGAPAPLLAAENFENGIGGWLVEFMGGLATDGAVWEVGVPCIGPGAAHEGTNCVATVLCGNYPEDRDARLVSQSFKVPAAATNPRLRFWHWWSFSCSDYGYLQITTDNGANWQTLASYDGVGGPWTRPQFDLRPYAGQTLRLGFLMQSRNNGSSTCGYGAIDVSDGWYIDEVRLLHDFELAAGSAIVRTQEQACVTLETAASTAPFTASFTLEAPGGYLGDLSFQTDGNWTNIQVAPITASKWQITMHNNQAPPAAGLVKAGSICFTATAADSAFAPLLIDELACTGSGGAPFGVDAVSGRAVVIGRSPLLEAWITPGRQRMATLYGLPGRTYRLLETDDLQGSPVWTPWSTNTVPTSLRIDCPVSDTLSEAPVVFMRATED